MSKKDQPGMIFPAKFTCKMDDGQVINDPMQVEVRGHFRRGVLLYATAQTYI